MIAALAAAALAAAQPVSQEGVPPEMHPEVLQVRCLTGSGSAFRIGPNLVVSVNHVTSLAGCFIDGRPVNVLGSKGDFSLLSDTAPSASPSLRIDCNGFIRGRRYVAIGYARGLTSLTEVDVVATGDKLGPLESLWGVFTVIPGQSGGAIVDYETGKVVGTVNVFDPLSGLSGSIQLKDTSLCRG